MLTEAPVLGGSGPLYLAAVTTLMGPSFGVVGVAEKRGWGRGLVGVELDSILSRCLKIEPDFISVDAAWLRKSCMRKAAFVS